MRFRVPFGDALVLLDLFAGLLGEENSAGEGSGSGGGGGRRVRGAGASDGAELHGAATETSAPLLTDGPTLPTTHMAGGHGGLVAVRRGATHRQQRPHNDTTTIHHDPRARLGLARASHDV